MSKGSGRRPTYITRAEEDLRWELIKKSTTDERKESIKWELNILRGERESQRINDLGYELFNPKTPEQRKEQIRHEIKVYDRGEKFCPTNSEHTVPLTPCKEIGVYNCKYCEKTYKFD